jgi:hypothetical protein
MELFPESRAGFERARSVYEVLADLGYALHQGYRSGAPDSGLVDRVFRYAAWCWDPRQDWALRNAVAVGFYEHVPAYGPEARRDLIARLSAGDIEQLQPLFRQMLDSETYAALQAEISAQAI